MNYQLAKFSELTEVDKNTVIETLLNAFHLKVAIQPWWEGQDHMAILVKPMYAGYVGEKPRCTGYVDITKGDFVAVDE